MRLPGRSPDRGRRRGARLQENAGTVVHTRAGRSQAEARSSTGSAQ
ncbi:hypothetical protein PACID_33430 [Acidipropionibacterium acidipropionici ATCC 4875]|uniref:Uncharacterized protein n=1 Tax=Acidipropionibacterium acidipropionici (strain ATCC 4875 / DSM 20272 / JCM 6432 / NBRC 12425 / NCIMB 8070 / 4) TaxID=1171373 RepID=K7SPD7_ACIA4|nr:hypothetical protein PACID_33430 [Acidipropionibacterium acidipropionici ATCC 4875]